mmetsp:Transcript_45044/g.107017  ORF Transcript_45044/g.107017 Transcript_45044/m.107017 type:complete len:204 (-) Transcript_45044:719-1330(-)
MRPLPRGSGATTDDADADECIELSRFGGPTGSSVPCASAKCRGSWKLESCSFSASPLSRRLTRDVPFSAKVITTSSVLASALQLSASSVASLAGVLGHSVSGVFGSFDANFSSSTDAFPFATSVTQITSIPAMTIKTLVAHRAILHVGKLSSSRRTIAADAQLATIMVPSYTVTINSASNSQRPRVMKTMFESAKNAAPAAIA